jgi:hypothetical protein
MQETLQKSGLFGGPNEKRAFVLDNDSVDKKVYFKAGQFVAWSLLHGGSGLRNMSPTVWDLMTGIEPEGYPAEDISEIPDVLGLINLKRVCTI